MRAESVDNYASASALSKQAPPCAAPQSLSDAFAKLGRFSDREPIQAERYELRLPPRRNKKFGASEVCDIARHDNRVAVNKRIAIQNSRIGHMLA